MKGIIMVLVVELIDGTPMPDGSLPRDVITHKKTAQNIIATITMRNRTMGKGDAKPGDVLNNYRIVKIGESVG